MHRRDRRPCALCIVYELCRGVPLRRGGRTCELLDQQTLRTDVVLLSEDQHFSRRQTSERLDSFRFARQYHASSHKRCVLPQLDDLRQRTGIARSSRDHDTYFTAASPFCLFSEVAINTQNRVGTHSTWLLIHPPSGPARKDTRFAMSSGRPSRSTDSSSYSSIRGVALALRTSPFAPGRRHRIGTFDVSAAQFVWQAHDQPRLWKRCRHVIGRTWRERCWDHDAPPSEHVAPP